MKSFINNRYLLSVLSTFSSILILLSGCAITNPHSFSSPVPEEVRKQIRHVFIVPAKFEPQIDYHPAVAKGRDAGAAKGAAAGAAAGAAIGATWGAGLAVESGWGILLLPFFIGGGAVIGGTTGGITAGIQGAIGSVPEETAKQAEETVDNALVKMDVQGAMAEHVYVAGNDLTIYKFTIIKKIGPGSPEEMPDYRTLKLKSNCTILEVRVISLGFKGGKGSNPYISIDMKVNARVIDVTSGQEIYSDIWHYVSREHPISEWVENNAQLLHDEFEHCYHSLAENIIEKIFLLYEFHADSNSYLDLRPTTTWVETATCGLMPFYPEYKGIKPFSHELKYPEIYSLQPTLEWEPFPREIDIDRDKKGILNRIDEVTYDLKIWKEQSFIQDRPLYTRQCIERPDHKVEISLEPLTKYFWTIRVRLKLDGQYRVTKWAQSAIPWQSIIKGDPCNLNYIPGTLYYRFKTPSE